MALPITVAEMREYLKLAHNDDDPHLFASIEAACVEWQTSTGRAPEVWTAPELMAIRQRVAQLVAFRGDDVQAPDSRFIDTIRRIYSTKVVQ